MKKKIKSVLGFIHTSVETIISLVSSLIFSKYYTKKKFKSILRNTDESNTIYILGDGSSLKNFLEERKNEMPKHIMVVNYFATTPYFRQIAPKHYIMLDNNLCIKETEANAKKRQGLLKALMSVDWNMNIYIPTDSDPMLIKAFKSNIYINLVLFNRTPIDGFKFITHFLYDQCMGMPRPQNISNAAVFCAIAAGFKLIYLYGIEHSWTKSFDVDPITHQVFLNDGHFYQEKHLRYFPKGEYMKWLIDIAKALKSHFVLREYADTKGVKIINKTKQSFVEAYDYE